MIYVKVIAMIIGWSIVLLRIGRDLFWHGYIDYDYLREKYT